METTATNRFPFTEVTLRLSPDALTFLSGTTGGINHISVFVALLQEVALKETSFDKRGIVVSLKPCEVEASANALAARFGIGRKPMTRLLTSMCEVGLIRLTTSKLTSVAHIRAIRSFVPLETGTADCDSSGQQTDTTSTEGAEVP